MQLLRSGFTQTLMMRAAVSYPDFITQRSAASYGCGINFAVKPLHCNNLARKSTLPEVNAPPSL